MRVGGGTVGRAAGRAPAGLVARIPARRAAESAPAA